MMSATLFTAAAIVSLALGIGATTLVFSLANGLLVRPLPYAEPEFLQHLLGGLLYAAQLSIRWRPMVLAY